MKTRDKFPISNFQLPMKTKISNERRRRHRTFCIGNFTGNSQKGQSLLEVIIALAIFALISSALVSLSLGGFVGLEQGGEHMQAQALAQEGIEAVRSIRDRAWNENKIWGYNERESTGRALLG